MARPRKPASSEARSADPAPAPDTDVVGRSGGSAGTDVLEPPDAGGPRLHPPNRDAPTEHRDAATEEIVRRLRSVEGHVRGVERMVGEGAYCIDVVNQILAVQRALEKVSGLVLERHLHTCVTRALRSESPDERERVIEEILDVFEAAGKG